MSIREHLAGVRLAIVAFIAAAMLAVFGFVGLSGGAVAEVALTVPKAAPQVFVVGANGQHLRQVTYGPVAHQVLFWMPGGGSVADIAYTAPNEKSWIESQQTTGRAHRRLSATVSNFSPLSLAFSAASRLTAFEVCCHNSQSLEVVGPPGSQPRVLDSWSDLYNTGSFTAAWSPNGRLIAYIPVDGPPPPSSVNGEPQWRITVITPNGQGRRTVTPASVSNNFTPLFSPDGQSILYCGQAPQALYTVPTTGGPVQRLTHGGYCTGTTAAWSPNGQEIAYIASNGGRHGGLFVINVRTRRIRKLAGPVQDYGALAWSPDGRKIGFGESAAVETINPNGTGLSKLAKIRDSVTYALAWSPNGKQIAFNVEARPCGCY